ncbi:MAG: 50S ribosomal protein L6 [Candidatus Aenigmatarchaeota archaeon]|nr:50S ribosomal protein L6 [Candidatus Aenigmarchaeota archaeon]
MENKVMESKIKLAKKIKIPSEVDIKVEGKKIEIIGPKGKLSKDFSNPIFDDEIDIRLEDRELIIYSISDERKLKAMVGTISAHAKNMIIGVTKGYKYYMKIHYVHFPISVEAKKQGNKIEILIKNFLGERKPRIVTLENVDIEVKGDTLILKGIDKEVLGNAAGKIERATKVKNRDRRVFTDGIYLFKKEVGMD